MSAIPATWMRGGTSKCWVFRRDDLEVPGSSVDRVLLELFGSPDPRQLDGVGGATSTTSKAVILGPSADPEVDVEYTFAQVGIEEAKVDWGSNCGNCSAVVAPFAVREGWVRPTGRRTRVRVLNTNTGQVMVQHVQTRDGELDETPTTEIPGVAGPGARVELGFVSPAGRTTGALFPTGNRTDLLRAGDLEVRATLVDAGAPVVVLAAADLGLSAQEPPAALDAQRELLVTMDRLRRVAAVRMGMAATPEEAARAVPKLALVAPPTPAQASDGVGLVVRMLSMGTVHPALPITGSVALTMAARTPGTVVSAALEAGRRTADVAPPRASTGDPGDQRVHELSMLTPAGVVTTTHTVEHGEPVVAVVRTYRRLVEGAIELPLAAAAPALPRAIA